MNQTITAEVEGQLIDFQITHLGVVWDNEDSKFQSNCRNPWLKHTLELAHETTNK